MSDHERLSPKLAWGIFLMPYIFGWCLLVRPFRPWVRVVGLMWMVMMFCTIANSIAHSLAPDPNFQRLGSRAEYRVELHAYSRTYYPTSAITAIIDKTWEAGQDASLETLTVNVYVNRKWDSTRDRYGNDVSEAGSSITKELVMQIDLREVRKYRHKNYFVNDFARSIEVPMLDFDSVELSGKTPLPLRTITIP